MLMRATLITLGLFTVIGCTSPAPVIDYSTKTQFDQYKSYSWQQENSGVANSVAPLMGERVKTAIAQALQNGGFTESQQPDMRVRYFVQSITETKESNTRGGIGLGKSGGNVGAGVSLSFPLGGSKTQTKHQIIIDLLDNSTDKLIWRATDNISIDQQKPEKITALTEQSVNRMLSQFPPSAGQ